MALPRTRFSLASPASSPHPFLPALRHLVGPGHLSARRLRPLSLATTATSAFSSASAPPPLTSHRRPNIQLLEELSETAGAGSNSGSSGGGAVGGYSGSAQNAGDNNRKAALMVLPRDDWLPVDPEAEAEDQAAIVPGSLLSSTSELEKFPLLRMLEGLMFFTKTAPEYEQNFFKVLEIVLANVAMAVIVDFMRVHLPVPSASLTPALANFAGPIAQFFHGCPDSALQIAVPGASYSVTQRLGALALNGGKYFVVGTASSTVRMAVRNALINARKVVEKSLDGEVENVSILSTSLACGLYMAIASNLRSEVLDGVIEQRIMEPLLHQHKLMLSTIRFVIRTGNTFLGSLLWIHCARRTGTQQRSKGEILPFFAQ